MPAPDADAGLLEAAVREAGAMALQFFRDGARHWHKPDGSPVTEADLAVDKLLRQRLLDARPGDGWLSEETPDTEARLGHARIWIADPIDGTRSFRGGGDLWCIGAALIEAGRPVLAAVYRPLTDELYWAEAGKGAFCNGRPLRVSDRAGLDGARIAASRSALKRFDGRAAPGDPSFETPLLLRLCRVAAGEIDGAFAPGSKYDWDLAPGDLMVHEAGGRVTGIDGAVNVYNGPRAFQAGLVAANRALHREMMAGIT